MNPRLRSILIVIGLLTLIVIGVFVIPRGLSLYYQTRGGQHVEYVLRYEEGIEELVCESLPPSNEAARQEVEKGITNLNQAIRIYKNNAQAYYQLGKAHCLLAKPEKAKENYLQYTELRPDNPLGQIGLGFAYEKLGEVASTKEAWTSAGLKPHEFNSAGDEEFKSGEYENALAWYEWAILIDPNSAESLLKLGKGYEALNEYDIALEVISEAWDLDPELSTSVLIDAYKRVGDLNSVESILQQMLENYPQSPKRLEWWELLGGIFADNSNWTAVIDANLKALNEFPDHKLFRISLGWAYYESNVGIDQAIEEFNKVIEIEPESGSGEFAIARLLSREKIYAEAEEYFKEALAKNPDANWWYLERANTAMRAENPQLALEIYNDLIERNPGYSPVYFSISKAYRQANQVSLALSNIDTALNLTRSPNHNQFILAGEIYEWGGEKEKALNAYIQALNVNPDSELALEAINRIKSD